MSTSIAKTPSDLAHARLMARQPSKSLTTHEQWALIQRWTSALPKTPYIASLFKDASMAYETYTKTLATIADPATLSMALPVLGEIVSSTGQIILSVHDEMKVLFQSKNTYLRLQVLLVEMRRHPTLHAKTNLLCTLGTRKIWSIHNSQCDSLAHLRAAHQELAVLVSRAECTLQSAKDRHSWQ